VSFPGGRRGPRRLTPEERHLWERVAATTDRRMPRPEDIPDPGISGFDEGPRPAGLARADGPPDIPNGKAPATPAETRRDFARAIRPPRTLRPTGSLSGPTARLTEAGPEVGPVGRPEAGLDRRTAERLRKGGREPDARIDLHGMSVERAHRACLLFLSDAIARGCRVVLVITGKGRQDERDFMSRGRGVLRESLPGWLRASPVGISIVGIYQAHQKHGGAGAFYVYLKRRR
jgi:DNA-nicking Smr family endonuclease